MSATMRYARILLLLFSTLCGMAITVAPASAMRITTQQTKVRTSARLAGQVTAVIGRPSNPTGFSLQLRDRTVEVQIVPRTIFLARSAEAQVEGFSQYVFALVVGTRANGEWTASRVDYDVVPFGPIRDFTVSGKITWVDKQEHTFRLKLVSGDIRTIRIVQRTRFLIDGQPLDIAPSLSVGSAVDVVVHRNVTDQWIALSVSLR